MSTTIDIEDRLTDLLARAGTAVDVHHDVDAVLADEGTPSPVVDLRRSPRSSRKRLTLAAAALVVLAAIGAGAVVLTGDDRSSDVAAGPGAGAYPVLDVLPEGAAGTPYASDVDWLAATSSPARSPRVRAVVGRRTAAGSVEDLVLIEVGLVQPTEPGAGEAQIELSGDEDSVAAIEALGDEAVVARLDAEGGPTVALDRLPDGVEVLVEPGPAPDGPEHLVSIDDLSSGEGDDGGIARSISARTGGDVPLAALARYEGAEPVEVGRRPGWHVPRVDGGIVAWTAANGTNVVVDVSDYGPDDDLAVAEGIRLVDEETWARAYPQDGPPGPTVTLPPPTTGSTDPSATTGAPSSTAEPHDPVGQVAPPIPGEVVAGEPLPYEGRWTVITFGATWCVPCVDLLRDLDQRGENGGFAEDVQLAAVIVGSPPAEVDALREDITIPGALAIADTRSGLADWGVEDGPSNAVLVGPDGTIRAVLRLDPTVADIDAALADARTGG